MSQSKSRLGPVLALLWVAFVLVGCGTDAIFSAFKSLSSFSTAKVWLEKVKFKAADNVNDTSPVTIHIIIAYNPELLKELMKMDAETYFRKLPQLKSDYAGQYDIFEWDIIRGQRLEAPIVATRVSGEGAVVFARYSSPGNHRATVGEEHEIIIQLDKLDFKVIPVTSNSNS
ncbi:hypothetical protein [Candidatus Finniella inopinata]|uniref:Type VI secretion system lipoprotein TssJ n=1 Tax=Candidatus Finniella inopinata TaxID=1696036 RepID=A0A4Q7DGH0_9PROT|nr:hypothetical protein [Candidatus Finniella inopinata]RZI45903.1 hypothetical protein EQU50_05590 [Candidatus Finniella inopinata]